MIVGVDRPASQMEDLQSADSLLGRRRRALIRVLLVAPSTHCCIHFLPGVINKHCIAALSHDLTIMIMVEMMRIVI